VETLEAIFTQPIEILILSTIIMAFIICMVILGCENCRLNKVINEQQYNSRSKLDRDIDIDIDLDSIEMTKEWTKNRSSSSHGLLGSNPIYSTNSFYSTINNGTSEEDDHDNVI
jgi:hypothetical protein